jgi:hypothetical protein
MAEEKKPKRYRLTNLAVHEVSLVERPANPEAKVVLFKSADGAPAQEEEKEMAVEKKEEAPVVKEEPKPAVAEVSKADFEELQKSLKALQDDLATKAAANVDLQKKLDEETKVRKAKDAVARATSLYKSIPAKSDELGAALLALSEAAPEASKVIEAVLVKCNEAMAKNALFEQIGKTEVTPDSAEGQLDAMVVVARKASPELSKAQAEAQVLRQNPDLYARFISGGKN